MLQINCTYAHHGEAILAILNDAIENTTALYDCEKRVLGDVDQWFRSKEESSFPVIGLESESGQLMGFATYGLFRPQAAFSKTVELSLYIEKEFRGRGLGKKLLRAIIAKATEQGYHNIVSIIDSHNTASIALHKSHLFTHCGSMKQVGYKFDRWLDVDIYQKILP